RFRASIERYRAPRDVAPAAIVSDRRDAATYSTLSAHLQLLDQVRQEGVAHEDERTMVALATAAERCESYVSTLDFLASEDVGRPSRPLLAKEIEQPAAAIEQGLAGFEEASRRLADSARSSAAEAAAAGGAAWPDLGDLVRTLEARQLAVRHAGLLAGV